MTPLDTQLPAQEGPPVKKSVLGACPLDCPDGCSWIVDLEDGKPVKLRANSTHPFTRNGLCVKTNPYLEYARHPDRLMYPQRRIGPKGSGQFERISWQEALEEIATNLQNTIERSGGEAIWPYAGAGTVGWIQGIVGSGKRLFHALGASRHDPTICSVAGHVGMSYTTNSAAGMEPEDLVHSKLILLWGTNVVVTNRHLWPFIKQGQKNGATVVTIDPLRTETAKHSDLHIPLRPGTDGALALGLMHHLFEVGAADEDYLDAKTLGWQGFRDQIVANYPLDQVSETCGIPADLLQTLATLVAEKQPLAIRTSMGIQRHAGGGQAARVLSCLPAITGAFDRVGGGICYSTGPCYQLDTDALCRPDLQPGPTRSLAMTRLGHGLLELDDPPVEALVVWAANPMASNPDQGRIRRGLSRTDLFTVVVDHFQTDTADYADILLPGTMQIEHADLHDSYSHLYLQWNQPAVEPPGECLPHTEIFRRLARQMGLEQPALYDSDEQMARAALDSDHPALQGITLEGLKETGWMRLNLPKPYQPFLERFPTESGKFEFYSERAERDGVGAYPHFVPPREAIAANDESLVLLSPANKYLLNSLFANSPHHKRAGGPVAIVHPEDARRLGIENATTVRLHNQRGHYQAELQISDATAIGVVLSPKGQWPKLSGGNSVNATVEERDSDMGRGAVYSDNRVFVEAVRPDPGEPDPGDTEEASHKGRDLVHAS
jgi:anaerobic selenocysteine-containing dehydrogenase